MAQKDEVLWVRVDTKFPQHPKIVGLSDGAFRDLIEMITWSKAQGTDGVIRESVAVKFWERSLGELCTNDVAEPSLRKDSTQGVYILHGYLDMQESTEDAERRKERNRANGRLGGRPPKPKNNPVGSEKVTDSKPSGLENQNPNETQTKAESESESESELDDINQDLTGHRDVNLHASEIADDQFTKYLNGADIKIGDCIAVARTSLGKVITPEQLFSAWCGFQNDATRTITNPTGYLVKCLRDSPERAVKYMQGFSDAA